ncbi:DNA-directed RNA polymerase subunit alpha C-terminal domain-containing protein [Heyndrickxia acidicola]
MIDAGINTTEQVLSGSETDLMNVHNLGEKRSREIWNSAYNSVIEYMS